MSAGTLRAIALTILVGAGDARLGEWEEWIGRAYHVKRRLTSGEEALVGPAIDIRHLPEARQRINAVAVANPQVPIEYLLAEIS